MRIRDSAIKLNSGMLIRDGKSAYRILLPEEPDLYEQKAADELNALLVLAGCDPLATDRESAGSAPQNTPYIVLGKCRVLAAAGVLVTREMLAEDGYLIRTADNLIILAGPYRGTLFAVYTFMNRLFSYEYFAPGELYIERKTDVPLYAFDILDKPDIAARCMGYYDVYQLQHKEVEQNADRLCLARNNYSDWVMAGHTYFEILPPDTHYEKHPDWYSPDKANLCLSNADMAEAFAQSVIRIVSERQGTYFMLGQEDNFGFCQCDACRQAAKEPGGESALMMRFTNRVAGQAGAWLKQNRPGRHVLFVTFAYNKTVKPPVTYSETDRTYKPVDKSVIAADNVSVMVVPFGAVYHVSFNDDTFNKHVKENFLGWQACCKKLSVWSYCVNFDNYMVEFNDYHVIAQNYRILKDLGTVFLFDQGPYSARTPCFDELKVYLHARLSWDTSLETDALIDRFMAAYYRDIAPLAGQYLGKMLSRWNDITAAYNEQTRPGAGDSSYYNLAHFWPKEFLDSCMDIFREARGVLESIRLADWDRYILLKPRLKKLTLSVRFLLVNIYGSCYGSEYKSRIETLKSDCAACGIEKLNEGSFMQFTE